MLSQSKCHKAVYVRGNLVIGVSHGEAFSKLPPELKQGNDFLIGNWDEETGRFTDDDGFFFTKKILMIRHGDPECSYDINPDPGLSWHGKLAVTRAAIEVFHDDSWSQYKLFSSPLRRCLETKQILQKFLNLSETISEDLIDKGANESRQEFNHRIIRFLETLPPKSLLISHCPFIENVAQLICGFCPNRRIIPPASMTLIDDNKLVYFAKTS
jgi:phosphohistidine phosphatase SixA